MSWLINDLEYKDNKELLKNESIFNLANGYIGVRGNFEEGYNNNFDTIRGTYINAFYELEDITYGEKLHGFPDKKQKLVNVIDSQSINIYVEDDKFSLFEGEVLNYKRILNMKEGFITRNITWKSPKGHIVEIEFKRMTSFITLELFIIQCSIKSINFDGTIKIISTVNGDVKNYTDENDPRTGAGNGICYKQYNASINGDILTASNKTYNSKLTVVCNSYHQIDTISDREYTVSDKECMAIFKCHIKKDETINVTKYNIYTDSIRYISPEEEGKKILCSIINKSFNEHCKEQRVYLKDFWSIADIEIEGDEKLQQGLRYNQFQLLQSVGKDKYSNIAAKGLSGEGYEGHYFWDTEIYIFPFFLLTNPKIARNLLLYRYNHLDKAIKRAKELGHARGALYPWRTINGDECSAFFPAGTAQYHINADVAYAIIQYYLVTNDIEFMEKYGAEMLFQTARLWADIGHFQDGVFKINSVTGPDEYTCIVDNNYYTNVMAKNNLKWAVEMHHMFSNSSKHIKEVIKKMDLTIEEVNRWQEAADNMYLPYNKELNINPQDDTFLNKAVWDINTIPKDKFPLLLNYHPLILYRYQICKQADTVLAHFLLEDEQSDEIIKNSYHYYEKITTHDSSLSYCIFSIMASKIGEKEKAYDYFIKSARLDLDDHHGNTKHGIHTANMGGTYLGIVFGFGGLRIKDDLISLAPKKPEKWSKYSFKFKYKGRQIKVFVDDEFVKITLEKGEEVDIKVFNTIYKLTREITI